MADRSPVMTDLSPLVRKPPIRQALGGYLIEIRKVLFATAGMLVVAPLVAVAFSFGLPQIGLIFLFAGAGAGTLLSLSRPQGQSIPGYLWGAVTGRNGRVQLNGEWVKVYVGLAPVAQPHVGQRVHLDVSAVTVDPTTVDRRGWIDPDPTNPKRAQARGVPAVAANWASR